MQPSRPLPGWNVHAAHRHLTSSGGRSEAQSQGRARRTKSGAEWQTWHVYPQTPRSVTTRSVVRAAR
ncbi:DUF2617 family protein [Arthrobacter hankyongi]|uniref:DUF2617 family protein n=1 Tax=Arthrobacter hankyongi TaxID=2904801 RepID=UPI0035572731